MKWNSQFSTIHSILKLHLQMELIDLQSDSILKEKFKEVNALTFYTQYFKSLDNYPELKKHAARILCMFGSTYLCEQMFSVMKINKNKHRTRLTNEHLQSILKINTTNMIPDINEFVKNKRCQVSGNGRTQSCSWTLTWLTIEPGLMKINKNKHRTRLVNEHLQSILKINTTNMI